MLHDIGYGYQDVSDIGGDCDLESPNEDADAFYKLANDASQQLYPGR